MSQQKKSKLNTEPLDPKKVVTKELQGEIGRMIQDVRRKSGLTARQISERMDISREALTQIETGRNNVSATTLWKLASLLGCDVGLFSPPVQKNHALTPIDVAKVAKVDQRAVGWAQVLFTKKQKDEY